jgi:transcriptional regulator with PAS, ATPase and Fis domain
VNHVATPRHVEEHRLIGISPQIRELEERIDAAARSDSRVLVTGESGSGKEVVARLIHAGSLRCRQPLVTFNCAGFPDSLLESELFGHVRGGFTGAERDRPGVLEMADRGTLFMDEVGEMSLRMQAVLLRFLETGELSRVGSDRTSTRVDVRIVAATNRDPVSAVGEGRLREDLLFRLNVLHIIVPPLRDRREDIPVLVQWFARLYSQRYGAPVLDVETAAMDRLMSYEWPGNIRQLKNVVERFVVTGATGLVTLADLPADIAPAAEPEPLKVERSRVDELSDRLMEQAGSFWSVVYEPFMARDLTRDEARGVIMKAWEQAQGNFAQLCNVFHIADGDTKRFLDFVRKHGVVSPRTFPRLPKPAGGQVSAR